MSPNLVRKRTHLVIVPKDLLLPYIGLLWRFWRLKSRASNKRGHNC